MGHDLGQALVLAEIREPGAHEATLEGHRQVVAAGFDDLPQAVQVVAADVLLDEHLDGPVHQARAEVARMQVHSGVAFGPRRVILHLGSYELRSRARTVRAQEPFEQEPRLGLR